MRAGLRNASVGLRHGFLVVAFTLPLTAVSACLFVWPMCFYFTSAAEDVLMVDWGVMALNPFVWPTAFREKVGDFLPINKAIAARETAFSIVTVLSFFPGSYLGISPDGKCARMLCILLQALTFIAVSAIGLSFTMAAAAGVVALPSPAMEPLVRCAFHGVSWVPLTVATMLLPFPRKEHRRAFCRIVGVMTASVVCYFGWRTLSATYFSISSPGARLVLGVVAPPLLGAIAFEAFYAYAIVLLQTCGDPSVAMIWLAAPISFGVATAATLQHGAPSILVGMLMEMGAMVVELSYKHGMLRGRTPLQENIATIRGVVACLRRRRRLSVCHEMQVVPSCSFGGPPSRQQPGKLSERAMPYTAGSEEDPSASESWESGATPQAATSTQTAASRDMQMAAASLKDPSHFRLMLGLALYSNIVELVVHMSVGAVYILGRLNPGDASGRPVPTAQVVSLLCAKIVMEVATDSVLASWASHMCGESRSKLCIMRELVTATNWRTLAIIFGISLFWALETQGTFAFNLCPFAEEAELGERPAKLGSMGLCPVGLFL